MDTYGSAYMPSFFINEFTLSGVKVPFSTNNTQTHMCISGFHFFKQAPLSLRHLSLLVSFRNSLAEKIDAAFNVKADFFYDISSTFLAKFFHLDSKTETFLHITIKNKKTLHNV